MSDAALRRSPLHDAHVESGAKFAPFGGWEMPLEYDGGGVVAEHHAVRDHVGVFDVSHLGAARIVGAGALEHANRVLSNDLAKIVDGKAQYTMLCTPEGGVVDDMIIYRFGDEELFVIPNAANNAEVVRLLADEAPEGVEVVNEHGKHTIIAVQGPNSPALLEKMGLPTDHEYMSFARAELDGVPLTVCRTGYTGEKGYELVAPAEHARKLWDAVFAADPEAVPAGLGARDTLRTEMGYPLHGNEISTDITPVEARLGFALGWRKPEFRGHEALRALKEKGPERISRALRAVGRAIPRPGMVVLDADGNEIGVVTSGTFSPTLKQGIALALVSPGVQLGDTVQVQVRRRTEPFEVVKPPFVEPGVSS